ncbi:MULTISPECIES: malate dehydrogenase (quinone) [Paraburkholderia]|uniref:Probable malate:quinone oxidoreductase n=1 Tax=Paraburkholderia tropica TaxID=92647 RepID=A0AAQ1GFX0_9BURK|nr:malate dehydrogenase (quinone) [Paraburkholderia tropica]PXX16794.1 malate dehydrogenase (quinone) [Paraburkholderia tropica]PZW84063.1 malate dehydrogenase (quinone) [Paraburkholderia tropica]RQN39230.1 malate dehydrogenase (quinone) [Paraburkholderia tropica]SEJ71864.1 malate dehydrogenase (quinone) [Paraburkholderia tropica]
MTILENSQRDALTRPEQSAHSRGKSGNDFDKVDVLFIGGGIMSATLGVLLHELEPGWSMTMVERLDDVAAESSNGWNNAGTGHTALAELNYTPRTASGSIDIAKAVRINEDFQVSRQFWAWGVSRGILKQPRSFINSTPHMSFVWGDENVRFLKARHEALQTNALFQSMQYSESHREIAQWAPLMMEGRDRRQKVAATWSSIGTDVNFGEITHQFVRYLESQSNFNLLLNSDVRQISRNDDGSWRVTVGNHQSHAQTRRIDARFVFVGAGGGSLPLLQEAGIPEAKEYGGFPVGGSFLVTENSDITSRHFAKAYGKASVGSPPMSVPHLDTRILDGKKALLFGPFATFSTKFLKNGSYSDLLASTRMNNIVPMVRVGLSEFSLIKYLAGQLMLSDADRLKTLQEYLPRAQQQDWRLWQAGQRVQIIKRDKVKGGVLKLGTEIVCSKDGSMAGLLGASPGASTAAPIMLNLLDMAFKERLRSPAWQAKIRQIIPGYGTQLSANPRKALESLNATSEALQLSAPPMWTPKGREAAHAANTASAAASQRSLA